MSTPKLLTALNTLTKDEWSLYRSYLLSKTKKNSDNFACYSAISMKKEKLLEEGLDERIRTRHFPQMSPKGFSNMLSRLFHWFEEWFASYSFYNDELAKELALMKEYNRRGLFKLATRNFINIDKTIKNRPNTHTGISQIKFDLFHSMYFSNNPMKRDKDIFQNGILYFQLLSKEIALGYLLEIENKSRIRKTKTNSTLENLELISCLSVDNHLTQTFDIALQSFRNKDLKTLCTLKEILDNGEIDKSSDQFLTLSYYLRICSISLFKENLLSDNNFMFEVFLLNLEAIDKNPHQFVTQFQLINAIDSIGALASFSITDQLIKEWAPKVNCKYPEDFTHFCNAINHFRHDEYQTLPATLLGLKYDYLEIQLMGQAMLLISQYMNGDDEFAINTLENFKKQLKRNKAKTPISVHQGLVNLNKVVNLLLKSRMDRSVVIDLSQYERLFFKSWVEKQIKEKDKV